MLALGIEGKRAPWEALVEIRPDPELADVDLTAHRPAQQQRTWIESVRASSRAAASCRPERAFTPGASPDDHRGRLLEA
ncbi:hypothetical protein HBB16_19300 [Pseudonocardia sp. MCCB 268]|nr:hypothetical protein [Pseudonocardia cytotoxica]